MRCKPPACSNAAIDFVYFDLEVIYDRNTANLRTDMTAKPVNPEMPVEAVQQPWLVSGR